MTNGCGQQTYWQTNTYADHATCFICINKPHRSTARKYGGLIMITSPAHSNLERHKEPCCKVPITYNGMPQIHPQNCPLLFDDHCPHLIHTFLDQPTHHPKWHTDTLSRFATVYFLDRQTDRQTHRPTHGLGEKHVPIPAYAVLTIATRLIRWGSTVVDACKLFS